MTISSADYLASPNDRERSMLAGLTLPEVFAAAVDTGGDAVAVIDQDQVCSWRQWRDRAGAVACAMQDFGVEPGDVVAVQLPNCMDFLTLHLAVAMVGAVLLPVHPDCGAPEVAALVRRTEAAVLVVPRRWRAAEGTEVAGTVQAQAPSLRHLLVGGGGEAVPGSVAALAARHAGGVPRPVDVRPDWPFVVVPSSGTTSARPKICLHTHDGLLSNAAQVIADGGPTANPDTMLSASSFSFLFGLLSAHICLLTTAAQVLIERWDARVFLDVAVRHRLTVLFAVPAQLHDVIERIGATAASRLRRLREVRTGGAPVPRELILDIVRHLADQVIVQWGMSEVGAGTFTRPGDSIEVTSSTIGRPINGAAVRVVGPDGRACTRGETGELQYRSPYAFRGYFRDDELTRMAVTADGWLRTGDLASVDPEGLVRFRGRAAETINVGGRKVNALEIEELLRDLRPLADAAVVGVPDRRLGEVACLVCAVRDGSTLSLQDVTAHLVSKGVARYKLPATLVIVDRLPYTPNGKLARRRTKALAADRAGAPAPTRPARLPLVEGAAHRQFVAVLTLVRDIAASVLDASDGESIPPEQTFHDIGFDSVSGVRLLAELAGTAGLELPVSTIFDHPTPSALAKHIMDGLLDQPRAAQSAQSAVSATGAMNSQIAIVGMSCRLPGGIHSPERFWRLLADGEELPPGRPGNRGWPLDEIYSAEPGVLGKLHVSQGRFIDDATDFDARFFSLTEREARATDPQQRLLLETCWEAVENAGITAESLRDSDGGVFVGMMPSDYAPRWFESPESYDGALGLGTASSFGSGRIAYLLGLHGPAITLDTACSSSLVALHLASQSLRQRECGVAIVGGVTVMSSPASLVEFGRNNLLAPDGRCKAFGEGANGVGLAEGAGVVVLQRLDDARRLGRRVLAVVSGSAVVQDGASNGLTAPNGLAQQRTIRRALLAAGLTAADIDVVEAHGTGTELGDSVEAQALLQTYGSRRTDGGPPVWLASVKSNIGHTQAAAGIMSVIKVVLSLRYEMLPRTLHAEQPSGKIEWSGSALRLLTQPTAWPRSARPRRAGVSAFGLSGTNAHAIVEEAPAEAGLAPVPAVDAGSAPWLLSARSSNVLGVMAARLRAVVDGRPELTAERIGNSLAKTRSLFPHRAAILPDPNGGYRPGLDSLATGAESAHVVSGTALPLGSTVFVVPGHGTQWAGMAARLMIESEVFAAKIMECELALAPHVPWSLSAVLCGAHEDVSLEAADVAQPLTFAVVVGLAALWRHYGVEPDAIVGHSQGEIAAAYVAGGLSLEDAARIVAVRGRLVQRLAGRGGMLAFQLDPADLRDIVRPWGSRLTVAVVNGPRSSVVSGDREAIDELFLQAAEIGLRVRRLMGDIAFHSPQIEELAGDFTALLDGIRPVESKLPFYSATTAALLPTDSLDPRHWYDNVREPVDLDATTRALLTAGLRLFIEVSPHPVLSQSIAQTIDAAAATARTVTTLRRNDGGLRRFLRSLAEAHVYGAAVDWSVVFGTQPADGGLLPTYPFQRRRLWLEPAAPAPAHTRRPASDDAPSDDAPSNDAPSNDAPSNDAPSNDAPSNDAPSDDAPAHADPVDPREATQSVASGLAALPAAERGAALLSAVLQAIATILERADPGSLSPEETFDEIGLTSLAAVEVRNVLTAKLDLTLPATVVLDNPTPANLAAYIDQFLLAQQATGAPGGEAPEPAHPAGSRPEVAGPELPAGFESLYRLMCVRNRADAAWDMVGAAARLRSLFSADNDVESLFRPGAQLVAGAQQPALACFPSVVSLAGSAEYSNFAAPFSGMRGVFLLGEPGFRDGEPLPADLTALVEVYARAVRRLVPSGPLVLCGRSFGGWLAHATAERLADAGDAPAGVILLDTFWPGDEFTRKFVPRALRRLVDRQNDLGTELGITRLTAIGWYLRLLARWRPERSAAPTLYLYPEDQTPVESHLRREGWQLPSATAAVAGDHFSMLEGDASATAEAIEAWLPTLGGSRSSA